MDLDFTCNLVLALEDLTEIFATAFIVSSVESPGTASSSSHESELSQSCSKTT